MKGFDLYLCNISNSSGGSLLEVNLDSGELGGEDFLNLSDDGDFLLSVLGVLGVLGSEGVALVFLLFFTGRGGLEFSGGVFLSLLLEVKGLLVLGELSLGVSAGGGEGFSLGFDLNDDGLEVKLGLDFVLAGLFEGSLDGGVDFGELSHDVVELFSGEGGSNLHEGEDGVGVSDLVQLGKGGEDLLVWLDGAELANDDLNGIDDSFGFNFVDLEVFSVVGSLLSEVSLLLVEDVKLDLLVLDVGGELLNLGAEGGDLLGGLRDFVGSVVDSAVVLVDLGLAVNFVLSVLLVSLLLVEDEVLSELLEHLSDVGEGGLVVQLEGDGVKELASELVVFEGLELGENSLVGVSRSLDEDGLSKDESEKADDGNSHV